MNLDVLVVGHPRYLRARLYLDLAASDRKSSLRSTRGLRGPDLDLQAATKQHKGCRLLPIL